MVWERQCVRLAVSLLLGCVVLAGRAWGHHETIRAGEWSLGTLLVTLIMLGALVGLGLFFAWPKRQRHRSRESVPPRGAEKQRRGSQRPKPS